MPRSATGSLVARRDGRRGSRYFDAVTVKERLHHAVEAMTEHEQCVMADRIARDSGLLDWDAG